MLPEMKDGCGQTRRSAGNSKAFVKMLQRPYSTRGYDRNRDGIDDSTGQRDI
jgi:hypothetical protein